MNVQIDPEFKALIPPLSDEERAQLEENIKADGCRDPLVVWQEQRILLDGHNRSEICDRNGIGYRTVEISLPDRNAATAWIIRNQLGRRNLQPFQRAELALALKPVIEAQSKEKQRLAGKEKLRQNSDEAPGVRTDEVVAKAAGVSRDTIRKAEVIAEKATPEVKEKLRRGEISINKAHAAVAPKKKPAPRPEPEAKQPDAPAAPTEKPAPWAAVDAGIDEAIGHLKAAAATMRRAFGIKGQDITEPYAKRFSFLGTVGAVNSIVRTLEAGRVVAEDASGPVTASDRQAAESLRKGAA